MTTRQRLLLRAESVLLLALGLTGFAVTVLASPQVNRMLLGLAITALAFVRILVLLVAMLRTTEGNDQ